MDDKWESRLNKFADTVINIVLLGFITIITSLPIFTIGASVTALIKSMSAYMFNEEKKVISVYFETLKKYFKQATLVWVFNIILTACLVLDIAYYFTGNGVIDVLGATVCAVLLTFLVFELPMVFVVIEKEMETKVFNSIKLALDISFTCFLRSIFLIVLIFGIPIIIFYIFPSLLLALPGVICYLCLQIIPKMLIDYKFKKGTHLC